MWYSHSLKAVCRVSGGFSFQSFSSHSISSHFEKTGAFRHRIPDILEAPTHYRRALKGLKEVKRDEKIANKSQRNRKFIVQSIDKLMVGLTAPLTDIIKTFRSCMASLHPYEKVVANLILHTLSKEKKTSLKETLSDVKKLRAQTSKISKQFAAEAKLAKNTDQAERIFYSLKTSLQQLYDVESSASIVDSKKSSNIGILTDVQKTDNCDTHCSKCLIELQKILQELRKVPVIEFSSPSVVLVGSPNVGKSTLVRSLSSGTPEVADYPFTTRGVSVGHIIYDDTRIQVMDTPGLLDRPVEARNDMEKLTFASMAYVPSVVIFVIDPTGLSGQKSTLEMQLNIRSGLRKQFPVRPWIDVITKSDIFVAEETLSLLPPDALFVSPKTGQGMDALGQKLLEGTRELKTLLEARKNDGFSNHLPNKDCIND